MIFRECSIPGAWIVTPEVREDDRGYFVRTWCRREFQDRGLPGWFVQCSMSYTRRRGTLRGLHYQGAPYEEAKLVRCTHGAIYDVIVDLRRESPTYLRFLSVELTAENCAALFVPAGCAHGFQTLVDDSQVFYQMTAFYEPTASRGVRWNDPLLGIPWPLTDPILHERDANYPDFEPEP